MVSRVGKCHLLTAERGGMAAAGTSNAILSLETNLSRTHSHSLSARAALTCETRVLPHVTTNKAVHAVPVTLRDTRRPNQTSDQFSFKPSDTPFMYGNEYNALHEITVLSLSKEERASVAIVLEPASQLPEKTP